ncbi:MAG TPA: DUF4173 domain-containing protein [Gemmatimonadales bacterium]|nr:DUF4173 domain-containing protein [Gemmatimonadales bacterium]
MSAISDRTRLGLEILGAGVVLGITGDGLLRATPWGLNALLCTTGLVTAAVWLVRRHRVAVSADAPWLGAAALLVASTFVARDSRTLHAFDTIGLTIVLAVSFMSIQGVGLRGRQAWHYVRAGFDAAVSAWIGVFPLIGRDVTWSELPRGGRLGQARAVALGVALAFPLLVVFGGLFSSADAVFHDVASDLFAIDFDSVRGHLGLFGIFTALTAGYLRGALLRAAPSRSVAEGDSRLSLGIIPVATALGLVDLLFLMFVVIQLRYLFGGAELIATATGLTYAEYARRGFFELVTASALVLPLLAGADWLLRNESREHQRTFRQVAIVLLLLLAVVMASALARMRLYVGAFGLSEIRVYSTAFMLYLAGVFAWFAWTTLRGERRRFAFGALVLGFVVLGGLHLVNPDALIVRTNLARPPAERPFDGWYAASLSADAVPLLLEALPRLDGRQQCTVAAGLREQLGRLERDDWRNWNFARAQARRLLRDQSARLQTDVCPKARS